MARKAAIDCAGKSITSSDCNGAESWGQTIRGVSLQMLLPKPTST